MIYSQRSTSDFIEDLRTDPTAAGKTTVIVGGRNYGTFDNIVWANTDDQTREYKAMQFLSRVRFTQKLVRRRPLDRADQEPRELRG